MNYSKELQEAIQNSSQTLYTKENIVLAVKLARNSGDSDMRIAEEINRYGLEQFVRYWINK